MPEAGWRCPGKGPGYRWAMGAWGHGNFDNDTACDWVYDLEKVSDLSLINTTVGAILDADSIDGDQAAEALAAIEAVARLKGRFGTRNSYTESLDSWVTNNTQEVPDLLVGRCRNAIDLILGGQSELAELWAETEDAEAWREEVLGLRARLDPV